VGCDPKREHEGIREGKGGRERRGVIALIGGNIGYNV
jgi:hypothetical protein